MTTRRREGDRYDAFVYEQLQPHLPGLKLTIGSGSVFGDQDQVSDDFRISVKQRSGTGLSAKETLQPYGKESLSVLRVPVTILRIIRSTRPPYAYSDHVLADTSRLLQAFEREQVMEALARIGVSDWTEIEWDKGLTPGLCDRVKTGCPALVKGLPPDRTSMLFSFSDFVRFVSRLRCLKG